MRLHVSDDVLERLAEGLGPVRRRTVLHLLRCDGCRERLGGVLSTEREERPGRLRTSRTYAELLDRLIRDSARTGEPLRREQIEAPVLLGELLLLPARQRRLLLRNSPRFRSWPLAELILDRGREEAFEDPAQAESLAALGLEVIDLLEETDHDPRLLADLRARGLGLLANTLRIRSDLAAADRLLVEAKARLAEGTGEPLEEARLLDLEASLRKDQRRFEEALDLIARAVVRYRSIGESKRCIRAHIKKAAIQRAAGDSEGSIQTLTQVLAHFDQAADPRHLLCAHHNLALNLTDLDRYVEAAKVFHDARPLYDRFRDPWTLRRRAWVEGKILHGLGQLEAAERCLTWAQQGFVRQEIAYDAALVSLDLAAIYAERGDAGELERLAAEMVPIFRARDVHREALAALAFFRQAAAARTVTVDLVRRLLDFLRSAQHDRELRFEAPGGRRERRSRKRPGGGAGRDTAGRDTAGRDTAGRDTG